MFRPVSRIAGEQHQAVGVALEAYRDVVDAVEPVQYLRVGLAALHRVDQRELTSGQVTDAVADVAEHLGDVAAADDLALQQGGRGDLHLVEGFGEFAEFVADRHGHGLEARRARVVGVVVGDPGELGLGRVGHVLGRLGEAPHGPHHGAADQNGEQDPGREGGEVGGHQPQHLPPGVAGRLLGVGGDLLDERLGDLQPVLRLTLVRRVGGQGVVERGAQLRGVLRDQTAGVDLQRGVVLGDDALVRAVLDRGEFGALFLAGEPGEPLGLVRVLLVVADGSGVLDERVGVTGPGREHTGLEGGVGGVGAQQRVQQIARGLRGLAARLTEPEAVDEALDDRSVRRVDVVGGDRTLFDGLAEAVEALQLLERLGLGVGQPVPVGGPHGLRLGGDLLLRLEEGGGARRLVTGAGRLVAQGDEERLAVLGLHAVDELGDLGAVPHELGGGGGGTGRVDLGVGDVGHHRRNDGERDNHQDVEFPAERPTVEEEGVRPIRGAVVCGPRAAFLCAGTKPP